MFVASILLSASKCTPYKPPKGELCAATGFQCGELQCNNPNRRDDEEDYQRQLDKGDICVNAGRFNQMQAYCLDLREKLIKCERE